MMEPNSRFSFWAAACGVLGASAVAIGAIASHVMSQPLAIASVEKASSYQLWHVLAILVTLCMRGATLAWARLLFLAGILLFCGSIYAKYFMGIQAAVVVAPAGGIALMAGWLMVGLSACRAIGTPPRS